MTNSIDVLIPVHNAAGTICSAVSSILQQSRPARKVIIIDDGSTDGTHQLLERLAINDRRVQVVCKARGGIVEALNQGLAQCGAPFIARHDADDLAHFDRFANQAAYLEAHSDCVAVSGGVRHIRHDGQAIGVYFPPDVGAADPKWAPSREPYLIHPFLMARRESLLRIGGYRHVHHAEDSDLYWRLREIGALHNLNCVLGDYRIHANSISGSSIVNARIMAIQSQLCAISACRRKDGHSDLIFERGTLGRYVEADMLRRMIDIACEGLSAWEAQHLRIAVSAKMLELTSYRPFDLDREDCLLLGEVFAHISGALSPGNLSAIRRMASGAATRLIREGRMRDALRLLRPAWIPGTLARLARDMVKSLLQHKQRKPQ